MFPGSSCPDCYSEMLTVLGERCNECAKESLLLAEAMCT